MSIGPSLGADSIRAGVLASIIAVVAISVGAGVGFAVASNTVRQIVPAKDEERARVGLVQRRRRRTALLINPIHF